MKCFGMGYWDVLRLPLKMFWSLNRQVGRLRAEEDLRALRVSASAQSSDGFKTLNEALMNEMDSPVVLERSMPPSQFDEEKFEELQKSFGQGGT